MTILGPQNTTNVACHILKGTLCVGYVYILTHQSKHFSLHEESVVPVMLGINVPAEGHLDRVKVI